MLWFPVMVNNIQVGTVKIVREEDFKSRGNTYRYRWEVRRQEGMDLAGQPIEATHLHGHLTHRYSDGAYVLMRKVLAAFERAEKKVT